MENRIFGLDSEYGVYIIDERTGKLSVDNGRIITKLAELFRQTCHPGYPMHEFLENGSRLYIDTGNHPEFATPECSTVYEAVKHLRAGNEIIYGCKIPLENKLKKELKQGIKITFRADNKTVNPDDPEQYNTHGAHESYLLRRKTFNYILANHKNIKRYLLTFLITRQIYTGSGSIFINKKSGSYPQGYVISPRAFFMKHEISTSTTSERAIIGLRDEPHTYQEELARLHIISGDANRSDWSNWLKIGITSLILAILDKQPDIFKGLPVIQEEKGLTVFQIISGERNPKNKNDYWEDYPPLSPIEAQKLYLEKAGEYVSKMPRGAEEYEIVDQWAKILVMLERNDEELEYTLDWKIKENFLKKYAGKKAISAENFRDWKLAQIDLKYHDLGPESIFEILEKAGRVKRIISDEEIMDGMINPPATTRARLRGMAIKFGRQLGLATKANWTYVCLDNIEFSLMNPFANRNQRLEDFIHATLAKMSK